MCNVLITRVKNVPEGDTNICEYVTRIIHRTLAAALEHLVLFVSRISPLLGCNS